MVLQIFILIVGFVIQIKGADYFVDGASVLAKMFGVSERMISFTIVALGTSLPELMTSILATRKGQYE